jgi:hypothetical protein
MVRRDSSSARVVEELVASAIVSMVFVAHVHSSPECLEEVCVLSLKEIEGIGFVSIT